jgi:hypothetical protein
MLVIVLARRLLISFDSTPAPGRTHPLIDFTRGFVVPTRELICQLPKHEEASET